MRRFYKGTDPCELTMQQLDGLLDRIADIVELETGEVNHRAKIERMARRRQEQDGD